MELYCAHQKLKSSFSGGDPMMAKDSEWAWLLERLEKIPHLQRLRIHSRLPVVIPERITDEFCDLLHKNDYKRCLSHINHPMIGETCFWICKNC